MKRVLAITMTGCLLLLSSSAAWSYTINSGATNVGGVDKHMGSVLFDNSDDQDELDWVSQVLGIGSITLDEKYDTEEDSDLWINTDQNDRIYAINFKTDAPEYFLIKTGENSEDFNTFLFENDPNLAWGALDLDIVDVVSIKNVGKLSHVDEFGVISLPEPATLLLLSTGFVGLVGFRKKFKK